MTLLHPVLRKTVALAARMLAAASLGALVLAAFEAAGVPLFLAVGYHEGVALAVFGGLVAHFCFLVQLALSAMAAPWCVYVLLAHKGNEPVRILGWTCGFLGLALPVNLLAGFWADGRFFADPASSALVLATALGLLLVSSSPFFQAAPQRMKARLFAAALLFPAVAVLEDPNDPSLFLWHDVAEIALSLSLFPLARQLAHAAFHVASLPPPREDPPPRD